MIHQAIEEPAGSRADVDAPKWTRAHIHAFRFSFPIIVMAMLLSSPFQEYVPEPLKAATDPLFRAPNRLLRPRLLELGAFVRSTITGDRVTWAQLTRRPDLNAVITAICLVAGLLVVSVPISLAWSYLDRRRAHYQSLVRWTRPLVRWVLGLSMLYYGLVKLVPTQFGFLTPGELLRPFGQLTPFWVLWNFMAASPAYTMFAGIVEVCGAALLLFPRTALLGAGLSCGVLANLVVMNLAYNVRGGIMPAVLLLVLSVFLVSPSLKALLQFFVLRISAVLPSEPAVVSFAWRYSGVVTVVVLLMLVWVRVADGLSQRQTYFQSSHPVYGMFDVESVVRRGETITALASDSTTWKRVASDGRYNGAGMTVQLANGDVRQLRLDDDAAKGIWTLSDNRSTYATLQYRVLPDQTVALDGHIAGEPVQLRLRRVDAAMFPLLRD